MKEKLPKDFIPSFDELFANTCEFVRENQGEKGYISTQDETCDTIYGFAYCGDCTTEIKVHGVKAIGDELFIAYEWVTESCRIEYSDVDFADKENWENIKYADVHFVSTLLNIADVIHEYV